MLSFTIIIIILTIILIAKNVRVVPQATAYIIERFGAYAGTWNVGLHFKIPFVDRVAQKINLKERDMYLSVGV